MGTRTGVADLSQQTCYALDHHASPKMDASIPELSNNVFSHSSQVQLPTLPDGFFIDAPLQNTAINVAN